MHRNGVNPWEFMSNVVIKNNFCLKIITLIIIFNLQSSSSYNPTIIMPYKVISSSELNIIGNTIQCNDTRFNVKTCAEECFEMENKKENCVGFLKDGNDCFLCKVFDIEGVNSYLFTNISENQVLYILKSPKIKPDVAISMDNFDLNTGIITGYRVSGGSNGITADDLIPGKVGQAIHFHSNRRIKPVTEQPECFCNFYYCNGRLSVSFWAREVSTNSEHAITQENGLKIILNRKAGGSLSTRDVSLGGFGELKSTFEHLTILRLPEICGGKNVFSIFMPFVLKNLPSASYPGMLTTSGECCIYLRIQFFQNTF